MPEVKTNDGCIIHVEVEGLQNAPVLMLSNSLGTNLHMWMIKTLAKQGVDCVVELDCGLAVVVA